MKEFQDRVAVVTGAASGIGRALAEQSCAEGMRVVLADLDVSALQRAERELRDQGATVLAVPTDVSKLHDVEALARATLGAFGAVHLLCNNAGVNAAGTTWESSHADWEWVLGVNLWGVIHGIRVFLPLLLEQQTPAHIVNTASLMGLLTGPYAAAYKASKHAVVALSEVLHSDLAEREAQVKVSVLCPAFVNTSIFDTERNARRGPEGAPVDSSKLLHADQVHQQRLQQMAAVSMAPAEVARQAFAAIRDEQFYVLTHSLFDSWVRARMENIIHHRNPGSR
jgi:NAD(P)-dependent dehydrogenase (short-subunit alcohol dehydrogenase family)